MMMDSRPLSPDDPKFPTTVAARRHLANAGMLARAAPSKRSAGTADPVSAHVLDNHILLGLATDGSNVTLDLSRLIAGRCLIQGSSGAGKSRALRKIIEEAHDFTTVVILDVEGEFGNLAAHIGAPSVRACETPTDGLTALAVRTRQHRVPLHVDLADLEPDQRIAKAAAFLSGLVSCPRELWANTVMVVIDEAHVLAPHMAATSRDAEMRRLGVATLTDLCSRGRKRGICPIIATQRLAKLASSVLAELHNVLIGLNVLDRDIARAGDLLGYTGDKAAMLRDLQPGQFVALGPAISTAPRIVRIGETVTTHLGFTPTLMPSAGHATDAARQLLDIDTLLDAYAAGAVAVPQRAALGASGGRALLDTFLLESAASLSARVVSALKPISPNATTSSDLIRHLGVDAADVHDAIDLLAGLGAIDTVPRGADRIVRLSARLRVRLNDTPVVGLV